MKIAKKKKNKKIENNEDDDMEGVTKAIAKPEKNSKVSKLKIKHKNKRSRSQLKF